VPLAGAVKTQPDGMPFGFCPDGFTLTSNVVNVSRVTPSPAKSRRRRSAPDWVESAAAIRCCPAVSGIAKRSMSAPEETVPRSVCPTTVGVAVPVVLFDSTSLLSPPWPIVCTSSSQSMDSGHVR
jgi:hypothetical protein